jgi:hypothetical protein
MLTTDLLLLTVTLANEATPSRQRESPTSTSLQMSHSNKELVLSRRWVLYSKTDWPTYRRS